MGIKERLRYYYSKNILYFYLCLICYKIITFFIRKDIRPEIGFEESKNIK